MNIALSAVVISILLIPPVVFYLSLYTGNNPRPSPKFSLFEAILACAVISLFIHAIAISFIAKEIRFDILIKVLGGDLKNVEGNIQNNVFKKTVTDFAFYNSVILLIMFLLGRGVRILLKRRNLHADNQLVNLYNRWWYFFNGYYAGAGQFDFVYVDAVVDTNDGTLIYSGYLGYYETKNGELDRIYLNETVRREFKRRTHSEDTHLMNETGKPLKIPGDTFSLKYENIINLNVNFILMTEEPDAA